MAAKKIMVVDDDKDFLQELKTMLSEAGYMVACVSDGFEAVNRVSKEKPDLILLDLRMRDVDGFAVSCVLKNSQEVSTIPIVIMSGYYTVREHDWFSNFCDIRGFIRKPFNPVNVISTIESVLNAKL